jgi:hypothetical protein
MKRDKINLSFELGTAEMFWVNLYLGKIKLTTSFDTGSSLQKRIQFYP